MKKQINTDKEYTHNFHVKLRKLYDLALKIILSNLIYKKDISVFNYNNRHMFFKKAYHKYVSAI